MCSVTEGTIRDRTRFLLGWDQSEAPTMTQSYECQQNTLKMNRRKPSHTYQHQPYATTWQRYRKTSESSNSTYSDYSEPSPSTTPSTSSSEYSLYSPGTSTENLCRQIERSSGQNQFRKLVDTISDALECEDLEKRRYFLSHEAEAILYGNTQIFESLSLTSGSPNVPEDLAEIDVTPFRNLISQNFSSHSCNSQSHLIRAFNQ
uniref:Uncharacterized protein n=1 Tax=Panagrolaimus sp. ES5 TaxID=591445 RepID=A0AC34GUB6_9BILA